MAVAVGSVTFDVILRSRGDAPVEHVVGEMTVPVHVGGVVDPGDIERGFVALGPEPRTKRGRRAAVKAGRP